MNIHVQHVCEVSLMLDIDYNKGVIQPVLIQNQLAITTTTNLP